MCPQVLCGQSGKALALKGFIKCRMNGVVGHDPYHGGLQTGIKSAQSAVRIHDTQGMACGCIALWPALCGKSIAQ